MAARKRKARHSVRRAAAAVKAVIRHRGGRAKRSRDPGVKEIMNKVYRRKLTDPLDHV